MSVKRILVIDDDPDLLFLVAHTVKSLSPDYQVNTAGSASGALEQMQKQTFDLAVIDYMMPGMTGLEAIPHIQQLSPQTEVVMMTAHHDTNRIRDNAKDLGVSGFVSKPFVMSDLVEAIKRVLEQRPAADAASQSGNRLLPLAVIKEKMQHLHQQTGAFKVVLVDANGEPVFMTGSKDVAKVSQLARFVASNFMAITELAVLFGDDETAFYSSYYEGKNYNIYAYNINGDFFLAVIFGVKIKPGSVWVYTRQTAAELAALLPHGDARLSREDQAELGEDFESLLG